VALRDVSTRIEPQSDCKVTPFDGNGNLIGYFLELLTDKFGISSLGLFFVIL